MNSQTVRNTVAAAALGVTLAAVALAHAGTPMRVDAYGLTPDSRLVPIDTAALVAGKPIAIAQLSHRLLGIDVRPADGMLYAVTSASTLVKLDPRRGVVLAEIALSQPFAGGGAVTMDFNPAADRLRLMSASGTNYRIHPDTGQVTVDGTLRYDPADPRGRSPATIVAGAYVNSVAGAKETALYTIDGGLDQLNLQAPPNDGVQKTKGSLGRVAGAQPAFDIKPGPAGTNTALLLAGDTLSEVDLATGRATLKGTVRGLGTTIVDLAILPASSLTTAGMAPRS